MGNLRKLHIIGPVRAPSLIPPKILRCPEEKRRGKQNNRGRSRFRLTKNPEGLMYIAVAGVFGEAGRV